MWLHNTTMLVIQQETMYVVAEADELGERCERHYKGLQLKTTCNTSL